MIKRLNYNQKKFFQIIKILFCLSLFVLSLYLFYFYKTFSNIVEPDEFEQYIKWDGVSVSNALDGTGSESDPYLIYTGADYIYMKSVIENGGNESYYMLMNNIDFQNNVVNSIGNDTVNFQGYFNGNGYSLANMRLQGTEIEGTLYNGMFTKIVDGSVYDLNFKNVSLIDSELNVYGGTVAGFIGSDLESSYVRNVGIYQTISTIKENDIFGGVAGYQENSSYIDGVYVNLGTRVDGESGSIVGVQNNTVANSVSHVVVYKDSGNIVGSCSSCESMTNLYLYETVDEIYQYEYNLENSNFNTNDSSFSLTDIASMLTNQTNDRFTWKIEDEYLRFDNETNVALLPTVFAMPIETTIPTHESGVDGTTIYVNDLEADWNYYVGRNYNESLDGKLPSGDNQNLYNETNLVKVAIRYSGRDLNDDSLVGYLGPDEMYDTFVYYHYYPISDGKVTIELVDNPFSDYPNNMAFNGWITDYSGAVVRYSNDYYVRYVDIPITMVEGIPEAIEITMYADWTTARVGYANGSWTTAFSGLYGAGFFEFGQVIDVYEDVSSYFVNGGTVGFFGTYPDGAYNNRGQSVAGNRCMSGSCTYYIHPSADYDPSLTYYRLQNNQMREYQPQIIGTDVGEELPIGIPVAGYYRDVHIPNGGSLVGYYDEDANYVETGTCNVRAGCDYYELIQYYDSSSQVEVSKENVTYYRLTTRDTNIVVLQGNVDEAWTSDKPFTLTGYYNDVDYRNSQFQVNSISVVAYGDVRIENITIASGQGLTSATDPTNSATATRYLYGRYNNVKIGRGIRRSGSNASFIGIIGGDNQTSALGSSSNIIKYRLIVESGWYNTITLTNGRITNTSNSKYVEAQGIYGNDYDRIHENNDNLEVYFDAAGAWGGVYYSSSDLAPIFDVNVLSGEFGTSKDDYTTGIYVGGRSYGSHHNLRKIKIQGGWVYNLIGGPITASGRATYNDTDISITGGEVDVVIGGAGTSATYGNRLIQVTGGQVNYSVFGGSNGYQGSGSDGTVNGSSLVYIGGNAIIGDETLVNNNSTIWGAEAGSVFGIGNGRTGSSYVSIGSNDNSNIIIDSGATIRRNVYGGGNYGATGVSSSSSTTTTKIQMLGGVIEGSLYGGGNNNGSGSSSKTSSINIVMTNGVIKGSLYGGSNQLGTIYGDVHVHVYGGTVENSIYGGGEGGYRTTSSTGTFVSGNVNVVVGNRSYDGSVVVNDSVYGGSAYGSVNGTSRSNSVSTKNTTVTINDGVISNVYGGGEGNATYTPYVMGNVTVNINGGNISNVYGGNDAAGTPNGDISVYLNGGMITNAYGGGNQASILTSDIYLNGSNVESIYGGGNQAGADDTNVHLLSGSSVNVYGGSNQSGNVGTTNVMSEVSSDTLSDVYFDITITQNPVGADEQVDYLAYTTLNVKIVNNTSYTINNFNGQIVTTKSMLYSNDPNINVVESNSSYLFDDMDLYTIAPNSSYELEFSLKSYFDIDDFELLQTVLTAYDTEGNQYVSKTGNVSVMNIYGGNNLGGVVNNTNVDLSDIHAYTLYGGGNQADVSGNTDVVLNQCVLYNDVFGGGNQANVDGNTLLNVIDSSVEGTVYGGGNAADVLGNVTLNVTDGSVEGSVYGGGNSADVLGNTYVTIGGNIVISENLFGGGNSGAVGSEDIDQSKTVVNLYGGTIGGNVYGGCNTSVVYGTTDVNIGGSAVNNLLAPIYVVGTVFGGGEANASGSEVYDFSFISVTKGIDIYIDGTLYNTEDIKIGGSIFGSGNASSSSGYSNVYVRKLGSADLPNKAISIQRANEVVLDNSVIELVGTTDRTNEYSDIKYSFNRIDLLKIKNGTRLLLQQNANLLKEFQSLVGEDGSEVAASVEISEDGTTVRNVDNRLYMIGNKNLNVTTNEAATAYGKVTGMTFFGMYTPYSNGSYAYGIYNMENNDEADAGDVIIGGSYVLGLHALNMDYEVDGFYTNYIDEAYTHVTAGYIEPTPPSSSHYIWAIGLDAINYSVTLTASKYASLGTHELKLLDFASGNTTFEIIGFNSEGLTGGVDLVDSNFVPKIADTPEEANQVLGLSMKAETTEWTGHGTTKFISENNGGYTGMSTYVTDNQEIAPSFTFYLYHAKNITLDSDLGTVVITLNAKTPINEIEFEVSLVTITIDVTAKSYSDQAAYDASITYGRKYEMPSATDVNITNRSEFTAYYSLYQNVESIDKIYGFNKDYYRVLTSNYVLPVGTKITMIDLGQDLNHPKYYYYQIDDAYYQEKLTEFSTEGEATYALNQFIAMDSISEENHYDDSDANLLYYHDSNKLVMEEFIFIFDFEDTTISGIDLDNSMILELRNTENRTSISVLGIRQGLMKFNLYDSSNVVLNSTIEMNDTYFYYDIPKSISYHVTVGYDLTDNLQSIVDTNYEANSMGINIRFKDSSSNYLSSSMLIGTSVKIGNDYYYPSSDGVFRIKLADKVSNLSKKMSFIIGHNMPPDVYTMEIDLFSSTDGLYPLKVDKKDIISFTLIGSNNSLDSTVDRVSQVLDGNTGLNLNGSNELLFNLQYLSELNSPNIRLLVYRRNKESYQSSEYEEIDVRTLTTTTLTFPSAFNLIGSSSNEYIVSVNPTGSFNYKLVMNNNLESGTYRFVFRLYDGNQVIDESEEYIIVKKFEDTEI